MSTRRRTILRLFGNLLLKLSGWRPEGEPPTVKKYVIIAAPHTSNWDAVYMLGFAGVFGLRPKWMGKTSLLRPPLGWLLTRLGLIPVDRSAPQNMTEQMRDRFREAENLILAVPPEGTWGKTDHWKSGFYHIAVTAGVPISLSYLDYGRRRAGFGPLFYPTGDLRADMDFIREFYAPVKGKFPDQQSTIRLREEDTLEKIA